MLALVAGTASLLKPGPTLDATRAPSVMPVAVTPLLDPAAARAIDASGPPRGAKLADTPRLPTGHAAGSKTTVDQVGMTTAVAPPLKQTAAVDPVGNSGRPIVVPKNGDVPSSIGQTGSNGRTGSRALIGAQLSKTPLKPADISPLVPPGHAHQPAPLEPAQSARAQRRDQRKLGVFSNRAALRMATSRNPPIYAVGSASNGLAVKAPEQRLAVKPGVEVTRRPRMAAVAAVVTAPMPPGPTQTNRRMKTAAYLAPTSRLAPIPRPGPLPRVQ